MVVGPRTCAEFAAGQRAAVERAEQYPRLLVGVGHDRGVQEQHRAAGMRPAVMQRYVRQPGRGDDRFDPPVEAGQERVQPGEQLDRVVQRVRAGVVPHHRGRRVGLQVKTGDEAGEAGAGAAGRPQQVGVVGLVGVDEFAVGGHHVDGDDALAGPAAGAAVPALAALQQVAAEPDRGAVPGRERAAPSGQVRGQFEAALDGRADRDDAGGLVVADVAQGAQVDEEPAVAQAPGRPGVPARADGDRPVPLGGQPDGGDEVIVVARQQDGRRVPVRDPRVEDPPDPGFLVAGLAPQKQAIAHANPLGLHCMEVTFSE